MPRNIERERELNRARNRAYYHRNIERMRKRSLKFAKDNPENVRERQRRSRFKNRYGITIEQFNEMLKQQQENCALCGSPLNLITPQATHVDHCHTSGKVRGLLHKACNLMIGWAADNPKLLLQGAQYVQARTPSGLIE